ncbi:MAG: UTP--glucose-1-phosphate uridylyltransferase [Planctomycetota bacterium]|jgi:UDP-N-acetylglucosamine/UDP-N-acetylgalactosamine diphosphorylase
MQERYNSLLEKFKSYNQEHVFKFYDSLDDEKKSALLDSLESIDLDWVNERFGQYKDEQDKSAEEIDIIPAPVIKHPESEEELAEKARALSAGEDALCGGRLAAFLVAGGQGTRLGFDGPKGSYPIGEKSGKTLFQIHAEQILARAKKYDTIIPWYIMTSNTNDADTRQFFAENNYFGFNKDDVMFFKQAMVPAVDFDGKLILESSSGLAMSPNGHGGSLAALYDSGAIEDMKKRGIDTISYFQVDNPLVTICDPIFAGYHLLAGAEMSSKVLKKNTPEEKVGVVCISDGKTLVIEYSDLDEENMYAKSEDGELKFWAGSIAIHMLSVDFVEKTAKKGLPWHIAIKKIPTADNDGNTFKPEENNGVKFETFVFDALPETKSSITMEVIREDEFAPVKNSTGIDSAESSRQLMNNYAMRMLIEAGAEVEKDNDGNSKHTIELSYLYALDSEELKAKIESGMTVDSDLILE